MRQIEETSEHIIVLAGPISYLLASDAFDRTLADVLRKTSRKVRRPQRAPAQVDELMSVLRQRKEATASASPASST